MTAQIFYNYILNPGRSIQLYKDRPIGTLAFLCLGLFSVMSTLQGRPGSGAEIFFQLISSLCGIALVLVLMSVAVDFIAQWFRLQGQSMRLFQWLSLSFLPILLYVPLDVVFSVLPAAMDFLQAISRIVVTAGVVLLQILTLQKLYQISTGRSVLIYCLPVLLIAVVTIGLLFFYGAMAFSWIQDYP